MNASHRAAAMDEGISAASDMAALGIPRTWMNAGFHMATEDNAEAIATPIVLLPGWVSPSVRPALTIGPARSGNEPFSTAPTITALAVAVVATGSHRPTTVAA
jgi:hypothetical protein